MKSIYTYCCFAIFTLLFPSNAQKHGTKPSFPPPDLRSAWSPATTTITAARYRQAGGGTAAEPHSLAPSSPQHRRAAGSDAALFRQESKKLAGIDIPAIHHGTAERAFDIATSCSSVRRQQFFPLNHRATVCRLLASGAGKITVCRWRETRQIFSARTIARARAFATHPGRHTGSLRPPENER